MGNCFFNERNEIASIPYQKRISQYNILDLKKSEILDEDAKFNDFERESCQNIDIINEYGQTKIYDKKLTVEDFTFIYVLGKGAFGKVLLVEKKDTKQLYAMKIIRKDYVKRKNFVIQIRTERTVLQNLHSPFIVELHYAFQTKEKLYLVMDFLPGGELFLHLRKAKYFTETRAKFYLAEILLALEYLHEHHIIYRDLKPENVLLDEKGHIKLADFGLCKSGITDEKTYTFCGTPEYLAPEVIKGEGHDNAVDYWSLGALLYELIAGEPPFYAKDKNELFTMILENPPVMKSRFSREACSLIKELLCVDPIKRLKNPEKIKKHRFFKDINWIKLAKKEVIPPFKPKITGDRDITNFDKAFTDLDFGETPNDRPKNLLAMSKDESSVSFPEFSFIEKFQSVKVTDELIAKGK